MKYILGLLFISIVASAINGQVISTEPAFPSQLDDVTIYFDATKGNGELAGFSGDIFAHSGVITNQSNSPSDWKHVQGQWGVAFPKTKMTAEGNDIYTLSFNIEDFYAIETGETVESLAFVFRNTDGSLVGRDGDGSDIYTPVFPSDKGLQATINSPSIEGQHSSRPCC